MIYLNVADLHKLLMPPHEHTKESAPLCSCGEWEYDAYDGYLTSTFSSYRDTLRKHTRHVLDQMSEWQASSGR